MNFEPGAIIKCDLPNNRLYHFSGSLQLNDHVYPLETKQILLRVCGFTESLRSFTRTLGCYVA